MDLATLGLLGLAAAAAGAINSVAGGGSLVSFPAALAAGLSPVTASATNTLAMAPGVAASAWAYRRELGGNARLAFLLGVPAAVGSLLGATLLLSAPESVFKTLVPWLVFGATLLIVFKDAIARRAESSAGQVGRGRKLLVGGALLVMAVYGGYFGAGMGILTLAVLALLHTMNIHEMNAIKTVIVAGINGIAAVYFLAQGAADLPAAGAMTLGALAGGYGGASIARRVNAAIVRWIVVAIGVGLSLILAYRYYS